MIAARFIKYKMQADSLLNPPYIYYPMSFRYFPIASLPRQPIVSGSLLLHVCLLPVSAAK